jgi:hypothetical protein
MAIIEALETIYLEADAASVTIDSIDQSYQTLELVASARSAALTAATSYYVECNGSPAGNAHSLYYMQGSNSTPGAQETLTRTDWKMYDGIMGLTQAGQTGEYATMRVIIPDYASSDSNKSMSIQVCQSLSYASQCKILFGGGVYDQTSHPAITQLKVTPATGSLQRGSEFTLYGIKSS